MQDDPLIDGYTIGPARPEELEPICDIAKVAWESIHDAVIELVGAPIHEAVSGNWRERKANQIRRQYENNANWVLAVRSGGAVAGFVTFAIDEEMSLGTIRNNAVDAGHQGKGIATAMYCHVLDRFRQAGLAYASVTTGLDSGHAPARRAYEKVGFDLRREDVTYYQAL